MTGAPAGFTPAWVTDVELGAPPADIAAPPASSGAAFTRAHALARLHGTPIGFLDLELRDGRCAAAEIAAEAQAQLGDAIAAHLAADGPIAGTPRCAEPGPYPDRAEGLASVIVCTRDRDASLRRVLDGVLATEHAALEVLVVDNAPATDAARRVVEGLGDPRVRYVLEPVPGLSRARNTGAREARGTLLAFTDDDVKVEPTWLGNLLRGFTRAPHVGCVTGPVLAAELETPAQAYIEARLNWSSMRDPRLWDTGAHREDDPMFPFSAGRFGTGANWAADRATWDALGGLDEALGAGTPTRGGEDLDLLLRVLLAGRAIASEPRAVIWHSHYASLEDLQRQQHAYGFGMGAYAAKHLLSRRTGPAIARRVPAALWRMARDTREAGREAQVSDELSGVELRGLLGGAKAYLASRRTTGGHAA